MEVHLIKSKVPYTDFEEVYVVIDKENNRLHISPLNLSFNITLDFKGDLYDQLEKHTRWGEMSFNSTVRKVVKEIIEELQL